MLLKQMKYFMAVVDCQNFTEAAEQCYISQSAISQQIKALEEELGVDLLVRNGRQFSLTSAGEYFYRHGKVLLEEVERLKEETIRRGEDHELNMTVGYPKNFASRELHQAIVEFTELYPEVNISIMSGTHEELFEYLIDQQLDIKISEQRRAFHDDYYNYELKHSDCYVEISAKDPLAQKDILTVDDLNTKSCILVVSKGKEESEREFYEKTLGISHRFLYVDSLEQARLMVLSHRGYLPIDQIGQLDDVEVGIKRIPLYRDDKPIRRNYFACWSKKKTNYYIEEFAQLLRTLFNKSNL